MKSAAKKLQKYIEGINGLLLILYSVFIFSTSVIIGNHFSKYYFVIAELIIIALSVLSYPFLHLGLLHLILIVSVLSKCRLKKTKDRKKILFIIPVFAYNFGTTILLTGIDDATRFFFYTYLLIPTLLVFLYRKDDERSSDKNVQLSK